MNRADPAGVVGLTPFHGLRYRESVPGGIAGSLSPSYDLESSDRAREFVQERPFSAVRLEISDSGHDLRFHDARRLFDQWRRDGTLLRDPSPSYYVYRQQFNDDGVRRTRRGLFGLVPLDAPEIVVMPHEDTWEDNLQRRYRLLCEIEASLSPILLLHDAPSADLNAILDAVITAPTDAAGVDDEGQIHELWRVSDDEIVNDIRAVMRGRRFLIADGHHRFAAARRYHRMHRRSETANTLALAVAQDDPGIVLRPIHRVAACGLSIPPSSVLPELDRWFDVVDDQPLNALTGDFAVELPKGDSAMVGLILADQRLRILRLRSRSAVAHLLQHRRPAAVRELDVAIVADVLFRSVLGVDVGESPNAIWYTPDSASAVAAVVDGESPAAVLLRPPRIEQVLAVARAHGRMPPKSTSFVPKAPIGLVMHDFLESRLDCAESESM